MRLVLLIIGAVVVQGRVAYHEDDPQQDDATDQKWFEEARKAGLQMDDNFAASYDKRASALSQAASDRRRWRRAGAGRIVRVPLTSSPGPGPDAAPPLEGDGPRPHHRRHASRQATRQNWPFGGRRVHGSTHPFTKDIEDSLREARATLRARETSPPRSA